MRRAVFIYKSYCATKCGRNKLSIYSSLIIINLLLFGIYLESEPHVLFFIKFPIFFVLRGKFQSGDKTRECGILTKLTAVVKICTRKETPFPS